MSEALWQPGPRPRPRATPSGSDAVRGTVLGHDCFGHEHCAVLADTLRGKSAGELVAKVLFMPENGRYEAMLPFLSFGCDSVGI